MTTKLVNGNPVGMSSEEAAAFEASRQPTPALAKIRKAAEILAQYDAAIAALEAAYSQKERETWPQQVTEARAHLVDAEALTPLIDAMLLTRASDTKVSLVNKIITNYSLYSAVVGQALGTMQSRNAALNEIDIEGPNALQLIKEV